MINVIQRNFDIKIDNYAIVNFQCFKKVIDLIGGIEAEIKDYEVDELNEFILEYGTQVKVALYQHIKEHLKCVCKKDGVKSLCQC